MSEPVADLLELVVRTIFLPFELACGLAASPIAEPEGAPAPQWPGWLTADERQALLEALLAVAACDGHTTPEELRLVATSQAAPPSAVVETIRRASRAAESVRSPEEAVAVFRTLPTRVRFREAHRHALDAAAAILSLRDAEQRHLVPRLAEALGLSPADADQALADAIVFRRPTPRSSTPYR